MMTKNGTFRLATLAHRDPQQRDILQQAAVVIAPDELSNVHPMTRVHRTREAMLLVDLASNKKRIQAARDYIAASLWRRVGLRINETRMLDLRD